MERKDGQNEPLSKFQGTNAIAKGVNHDSAVAVKSTNDSPVKSSKPDSNNVDIAKGLEKDFPPKPVPRKGSRRKPSENNPVIANELEGGTVVSIYEKRDDSPARRLKKNNSSAEQKVKNDTEKELKSGPRRELNFKSESKDSKEAKSNVFSLLGPGKPRVGLTPLDGDEIKTEKETSAELSPPFPMDLDDSDEEKKDPDIISKNAPSDATVHRFRAMRMAPDRSRSEESLKNAQFAPKPPSTPRSKRRASMKGEKRNRESNSSGEEADKETKKQNSVNMEVSDNIVNSSLSNLQVAEEEKMEVEETKPESQKSVGRKGLSIHPDVKEVTHDPYLNVNQNMYSPVETESSENVTKSSVPAGVSRADKTESSKGQKSESEEMVSMETSPEKDIVSDDGKRTGDISGKKSDKKRIIRRNKVKPLAGRRELKPLDGAEETSPNKSSLDTVGSASDLRAISENYQQVLDSNSPVKTFDISRPSTSNCKESVIPEPDARAGKLDPIQPKTLPPPLPQDMKSTSLRTTYKTDPAYSMSKFFGKSFTAQTGTEKAKYEVLSARSLSASSALPVVSTREARDRWAMVSYKYYKMYLLSVYRINGI